MLFYFPLFLLPFLFFPTTELKASESLTKETATLNSLLEKEGLGNWRIFKDQAKIPPYKKTDQELHDFLTQVKEGLEDRLKNRKTNLEKNDWDEEIDKPAFFKLEDHFITLGLDNEIKILEQKLDSNPNKDKKVDASANDGVYPWSPASAKTVFNNWRMRIIAAGQAAIELKKEIYQTLFNYFFLNRNGDNYDAFFKDHIIGKSSESIRTILKELDQKSILDQKRKAHYDNHVHTGRSENSFYTFVSLHVNYLVGHDWDEKQENLNHPYELKNMRGNSGDLFINTTKLTRNKGKLITHPVTLKSKSKVSPMKLEVMDDLIKKGFSFLQLSTKTVVVVKLEEPNTEGPKELHHLVISSSKQGGLDDGEKDEIEKFFHSSSNLKTKEEEELAYKKYLKYENKTREIFTAYAKVGEELKKKFSPPPLDTPASCNN